MTSDRHIDLVEPCICFIGRLALVIELERGLGMMSRGRIFCKSCSLSTEKLYGYDREILIAKVTAIWNHNVMGRTKYMTLTRKKEDIDMAHSLRIQVGKSYRSHNGSIAKVVHRTDRNTAYPYLTCTYTGGTEWVTESGRHNIDRVLPDDLANEMPEPTAQVTYEPFRVGNEYESPERGIMRVVYISPQPENPVPAVAVDGRGIPFLFSLDGEGQSAPGIRQSLTRAQIQPEAIEVFLNVYRDTNRATFHAVPHWSREKADKYKGDNRVACLHVIGKVGMGLP